MKNIFKSVQGGPMYSSPIFPSQMSYITIVQQQIQEDDSGTITQIFSVLDVLICAFVCVVLCNFVTRRFGELSLQSRLRTVSSQGSLVSLLYSHITSSLTCFNFWQTLVLHLYNFVISRLLNKWIHIIIDLLRSAFFTQ